MRGPGASRLPADKLEAEMLETLVNMLLRHPTLSSAGCSGSPGEPTLPCPVPWQCYLQICKVWGLQANQVIIKNQWISNLSWRKKLAQNQMFTWNVSSIAPSRIFHQLFFKSPCPSHGLWQQLKKSISDQHTQCCFSLHLLTMHSPFAQVSFDKELNWLSDPQDPCFPDS